MLYGDMNEEMLLKKRLVQHKVTINCQFVKKKKKAKSAKSDKRSTTK